MMHDKTTERLKELPPGVADLLGQALAYTAELEGRSREPAVWMKEKALYDAALAAVDFPKHAPPPNYSRRVIEPASTLSGAQRVVAEILAHVPGPDLQYWCLPAPAWVRRQWLGIDPPGPLFSTLVDGEPIYFAARKALNRGPGVAEAMITALAPATRLAVLADLQLAALDFWEAFVAHMLGEVVGQIGTDAGAWARTYADLLLELFEPQVPMTERGNRQRIPAELSRAAFVAMVRAGVVIEPRWDRLLLLGSSLPAGEIDACIAAIPEERRAGALRTAIEQIVFVSEALTTAMQLRPPYPHQTIAAFVLERLDKASKPKQVLKALKDLAKGAPGVAAALAAHANENEGVPSLRVHDLVDPITLEALDATARLQLERSNEKYGGRLVPAEELFRDEQGDVEEQIMPSLTRRYRLSEGEVARYDVWEYMGDSGTIFAAGTSEVVGEIIQGGLEVADRKLKLALNEAISEARAKRAKKKAPATERTSTKKTASTRGKLGKKKP